MGATIAEKILARASGKAQVRPGELVWATPDLTVGHDRNYPRYRERMKAIGVEAIAQPQKFMVTIDHTPYSDDVKTIETRAWMRKDIAAQGVGRFFDLGRHGISHNIPVDHGLVKPGMLVITSDTRSPALGCAGALSIALGAGFLTVLVTGKAWLRVPATIRVTITGTPGAGVLSRDIGEWVAQQIGASRADYRVIEFAGDTVERFGMDERHTLCNAMVDIGVKSAIVPADEKTEQHCSRFAGEGGIQRVHSDHDAQFEAQLELDVSCLEPQVSRPPSPENVCPVGSVRGQKIDQAFVGTCIGGKLEDLRAAAGVLRGRTVHPSVRLLVIPATHAIYEQALGEGLMQVFAEAGAQIAVGACGPCFGVLAPLGKGETSIATATRNEPGRMGSDSATIFLANAATVAASAVRGVISDPREFLGRG